MIKLRKLNGKEFIVNCDLIETVESTPDTIIILTTGRKFVVLESVDEIINKVILLKKQYYSNHIKKHRNEV